MKQIDADGINGDTQDGVPLGFSLAAEKIGHPLAFEPESSPSDEALAWNVMTWGQYSFPFIPMVDRYKWLETRHMVNISDRWNRDKTNDLQFAFFNGVGWESWENVWGIWNGINPARCRSHPPRGHHRARRCAVPRQPRLGAALSHAQLRRLRQPLAAGAADRLDHRQSQRLRHRRPADGCAARRPDMRYFDLYHGVELKPEPKPDPSSQSPC